MVNLNLVKHTSNIFETFQESKCVLIFSIDLWLLVSNYVSFPKFQKISATLAATLTT